MSLIVGDLASSVLGTHLLILGVRTQLRECLASNGVLLGVRIVAFVVRVSFLFALDDCGWSRRLLVRLLALICDQRANQRP